MATRVRPLHDRIVVRAETKETVSKGGIFIPSLQGKEERIGEVVAVGDGYINNMGVKIPVTLKIGDRVLFGSYAGTEIEIDGDSYRLMREGDVVAVLDPEADVSTDGISSRRRDVASQYR